MLQGERARRVGAGAMVIVCATLASTAAHAFEVKKTSSGQPLHWEESSVVFQTDPSVDELSPGASEVLARAAASWSSVEGAPSVSVQPATGPSRPSFDGKNTVYFYPEGYGPAGDALAITIVAYDDATGRILDADIVFNGAYSLDVLPDGATAAPTARRVCNDGAGIAGVFTGGTEEFDIGHIAAHEMGHALGMADETRSGTSLMYLYTLPGDASPRAPTQDDLDGLAVLYGTTDGRGCSSSTVASRRPRVPPLGLLALLGGLIGAAIARRARERSTQLGHRP